MWSTCKGHFLMQPGLSGVFVLTGMLSYTCSSYPCLTVRNNKTLIITNLLYYLHLVVSERYHDISDIFVKEKEIKTKIFRFLLTKTKTKLKLFLKLERYKNRNLITYNEIKTKTIFFIETIIKIIFRQNRATPIVTYDATFGLNYIRQCPVKIANNDSTLTFSKLRNIFARYNEV